MLPADGCLISNLVSTPIPELWLIYAQPLPSVRPARASGWGNQHDPLWPGHGPTPGSDAALAAAAE